MAMPALLIRGARVYAPEPLGVQDVLAVGETIVAVGPRLELPAWADGEEIDGRAAELIPGLIDQHVHIAGGGGEGGPINRTPEIMLSQLTRAGITTVVGVLGTDGSTRHVQGLLAKARQLMAEGITAWIYTGAYEVPTRTVTDNPRTDIVLIDRVLGVGEIAISDHRGTHPSDRELAHLAGEARVGGLLGGKAGVLHLHVGDGARRLEPLRRVVAMADVPRTGLVPTHLNRNPELLAEAQAWARDGGYVDLTTDIHPDAEDPRAIWAHRAALSLREAGVAWDRVSFSSDAQGSSPIFDAEGRLVRMDVGRPATLFTEMVALVRRGLPWHEALAPVTTTPARILGLHPAGTIRPGAPADLVLVEDFAPRTVVARGRVMVRDGEPVVWGRFERIGG
jgi:beta-aspartyl-dipeptidase (metallo-type)